MRVFATVSLLVGLSLLLSIPARAAVVYVNKNAAGAVHDGTSWGTAFLTVLAGVNAATGDDEVWVAQGTYVENVVTLPPVFGEPSIYGGFTGSETQRSQRDWTANPTTLDGNQGGTVVRLYKGSSIDGFTIRNGKNGISAEDGASNVTNCIITGNSGYGIEASVLFAITIADNSISGNGIGVYVHSGPATLTGNTISSNAGNGVEVLSSTASIDRCCISGNGGIGIDINGGGIPGSALITNTSVCANRSQGVACTYATVTLTNAVIARNTNAGVAVWHDAVGKASNAIVAFNGANGVYVAPSGGFALVGGAISQFSHNDVYGNTGGEYSGYTPQAGLGNISADPLFQNNTVNYHLQAGSPCFDAGDDSVVTTGETDLDGNPRIRGAHVDIGAFEAPVPTTSVSLATTAEASPASVEGIVYTGGDNGKLYAFTSPSLSAVPGFPVDISAAVGTPVKLNTRPAVYYGKTGKAIYLTTNLGHVVKVWPSGQVAWAVKPADGAAMSTPAVTPDGHVYVNLGEGTANVASHLIDIDESSGWTNLVSPALGSSPANALFDRSAAVRGFFAYVNTGGDSLGSLAVLNQDNLTVRASFASGEDALAPFLNGQSAYVATRAGNVYKVNGVTMNVDLAFGASGAVSIGEGVTAGPFLDAGGSVYVGTASGKVWKMDGTTGAKSQFVDSGTNTAIAGLLVTRSVLAFATASGTLQQVSLTNPASKTVETLSGPPAGGPVYDAVQARMIVATTAGQVYSIPGL